MYYLFAIFVFMGVFSLPLRATEKSHKIVCLLSGPRSLSTVFLRMMESRGDFTIYHEPLIPMFAKEVITEHSKGWFLENAYTSFAEMERDIYLSSQKNNVFIKEMSFAFYKQLLEAQNFIKNPSIHFILMIRNPHHSVISFYHRIKHVQAKLSEVIGLKDLYEEYELIKRVNPGNVKIIFSEQLYTDPRKTNIAVCNYLDIPFLEESLIWKKYDQDFDYSTHWNEAKRKDMVFHWHGRAIQSVKMGKPSEYEVDSNGEPTFSEILDQVHKEACKEVYLENLVYYKKFLKAQEDFLIR